jgi:Tfp pilus assembly protein PilF
MDLTEHHTALALSVAALQRGDRHAARCALTAVLKHEPQHPLAWLYFSLVMPTREHADHCLEQSFMSQHRGRPRIGAWLIRHGLITASQLEHALAEQVLLRREGVIVRLGDLLIRAGALDRDSLERALLARTAGDLGLTA